MSCNATTKRGQPCRARPLKGTDTCLAHSDKEKRDSTGFGGPQPGAGRPRNPRMVDLLTERVEANAERWLAVPEGAIDAVTTKFHGPAGEQFAEEMEDWTVRLRAWADVMDRVCGKPKQATELSGPDGGPVRSVAELDFADPETRKLAHELLARRAKRTG